MKINNDHNAKISALFAARANMWAPKYEPQFWNVASQGAYNALAGSYKDILDAAAEKLALRLDRPNKVAQFLRRFTDDNLRLVTGRETGEIATMRQRFMSFLETTSFSTNCYAYALNVREGMRAGDLLTPGYLNDAGGEYSQPMEGKTITALFDGLARDGFAVFNGDPNRDRPQEGHYLAAVLVKPGKTADTIHDFHFIRYDRDGGCSHKLGHGYVTRLDHNGQLLTDPVSPEAFSGYRYEGCIAVPAVLPQHTLKP